MTDPRPAPILVVDNDDGNRDLVAFALRRAGFEVLEAPNGQAALDVIQTTAVGLIVLHMRMPGMSGTEVVQALRSRSETATLPILLMTGSGDEDSLIRGLAAGADDFLPKPVRLDELIARVNAHLRRQGAWSRVVEDGLLESIARIGSYSLDIAAGRWVSSKGLDAIFGIDATFDRSVEGWASLVHPADREAMVAYLTIEVLGRGQSFDRQFRIVRADTGAERWVHGRGVLELDGSGRPLKLFGTIADITEQRSAQEAQEALTASELRYAAIFEGTAEAILIAEVSTQRLRWVNSAACALLGYTRDELLELSVHDIHPTDDLPAVLDQFHTTVGGRITVARSVPCVQKDGTVRLADIRGSQAVVDGVVCNIAFFTDVTALRAAESSLAREFRERACVAAALARLQPRASAEETAAEICDELLGLPGIDAAMICNFLDPERAVPLAVSGPDGLPMAPGRPLPAARAKYLYDRAAQGPWAEAWRPRPADGRYGHTMVELGFRAVAYAPIRNGDSLLGVVAVGTRDEAYVRHLIDHLPAVGEFAATARVLISGQLERGHRDELVRERVRRALAKGGLGPVFQPIVALGSGTAIGYEALTRFADGTPPDRMIAEAHTVDLGLELEVACLAAALEAAEALPQDAWLSLNVSPGLILHSGKLRGLLAGRSRRFVLEVTEHAEIDDYAAVRRALAEFEPTVSLAVDDAGAGFASLRHVVELAPRFLKLDVTLVRHVDRDLTRQAMIAGLSHFAARADCEVIAEGIEDPVELEMLRELGVSFGQGYLLGRPEPLRVASGNRATRAGNNRPPVGRRPAGRFWPRGLPGAGRLGVLEADEQDARR
ncbi:MAG TPA: EAL domain-containing protein [Candidatus Limnocylindrales bacterium]